MIRDLLNDYVLDNKNPFKIYKVAREYERLQQAAAAFTFYMRAAEYNDESTFEEKWIQYKSLICMALIHHREQNRDVTARGLFMHAISVMPERPEAYYIFSEWLADRHEWREALTFSSVGLNTVQDFTPIDNDLNYVGKYNLQFVHAISKWKTEGSDRSKNLLFDFKYKTKHNDYHEELITRWISQAGYPSTLAYTKEEADLYKWPFDGIEDIDTNYSRHFQDMFVLSVNNGKRNGTFIEIGSGDPYKFNNTALLEDSFGWTGLSLDNSEEACSLFSRKRKSTIILSDALNVNYQDLFKMHCFDNYVDFLRINSEATSLEVLKNIPWNKHEFGVIQFQHNFCWWQNDFRDKSREILKNMGYVLFANDIAVSETENYEDWWLHPTLAAANKRMKTKKDINFAWEYMMKEHRE